MIAMVAAMLGVLAVAAGPGANDKYVPLVDPTATDQLFAVNVNNYWGLMNQVGRLVIEPRYDWTENAYEGKSRVVQGGWTFFIAGNGSLPFDRPLAQQSWKYADRFCDGYAVVGDGKHFGIINSGGDMLHPINLDGVLRFRENMAAVRMGDRCGFLDKRGQLAIELRYVEVHSFSDGRAAVRLPDEDGRPGMAGYINVRGDWVFRDQRGELTELGDFSDGLARVRVGQKWGYIDQRFKPQIAPNFDQARDFVNGKAAVCVNDLWGYIDKRGSWLIEPRFASADDFDESQAMVELGGLWGYTDLTGRMRIEAQYPQALPFYMGLAMVRTAAGWGYVDTSGRWVFDPVQAKAGFVDLRAREHAAILANPSDTLMSNRVYNMPAYRDPIPVPYSPEYQYDPVLRVPAAMTEGNQPSSR